MEQSARITGNSGTHYMRESQHAGVIFTMINYKTYNDLYADIIKNIHKIPHDIDMVVGVPRSGMLAAT